MAAMGWTRSETRGTGALWFVLVAVVCALVAAYVALALVRSVRRTVPVVVARRLVPPLAPVTAADVALADLPALALPPEAFRRPAAVVGAYTRMGLVPGEVVTATALSGGVQAATAFDVRLARLADVAACRRGGSGRGARVPPPAVPVGGQASVGPSGCRDLVAVSLPLSADQGYQLVRAGDVVDVAATYTLQSGTVSQVVAADVPVLYRVNGSASGGVGFAGQSGALGAGSGWLVLGVPPGQALRLQLAENTGRVDVFLRPPGAPAEPAALQREVVTTADLAGAVSSTPPSLAGQLP